MPNKRNYQRELDDLIAALDRRPRLLLHCCCAPCSSYVLEYLASHFDITTFYYNPNISPEAEFRKRADELRRLLRETGAPAAYREGGYDPERFFAMAKGMEEQPEGGARCAKCYELRLRETAALARAEGFDYFTTTLSISPYKDAEKLNEIGGRLAQEYGVAYLYSDFKKKNGYRRSIELSEEYGLYRQDYCGCVFSKREAEQRRAGRD